MSTPTRNENDPGASGGSQKLSTVMLGQKSISALHSSKNFNIFIRSPSQINDLGLAAKMKNGKPITVHENKDTSSTKSDKVAIVPKIPEVIAQPSCHTEGGSSVSGISLKTQTLKVAVGKTASKKQKLQDEIENSKPRRMEEIVTSAEELTTPAKPGASASHSMELWRNETKRYLPRFAEHWVQALEHIGYINCPMMSCNYISLTQIDMINHYKECDGKTSITANACPVCMHRLGSPFDLVTHMSKSHQSDGFHRKTLQQIAAKSDNDMVKSKLRLLPKRRSSCKVHRTSWNIAIESKGYVKCLFKNCNYLALTVDEMKQHYGICNGGGVLQMYTCPFVCPYCNGFVETRDKLTTHLRKSHFTEAPIGETVLPTASSPSEFVRPYQKAGSTSSIKTDNSDSYITTLNPSHGNTVDDKNIQLISLNNIKVESTVNVKEEVLEEPNKEHIVTEDIVEVQLCDSGEVTRMAHSKDSLEGSKTFGLYSNECEGKSFLSTSGDSEWNKTEKHGLQPRSEIRSYSVKTYGRRKCSVKDTCSL